MHPLHAQVIDGERQRVVAGGVMSCSGSVEQDIESADHNRLEGMEWLAIPDPEQLLNLTDYTERGYGSAITIRGKATIQFYAAGQITQVSVAPEFAAVLHDTNQVYIDPFAAEFDLNITTSTGTYRVPIRYYP